MKIKWTFLWLVLIPALAKTNELLPSFYTDKAGRIYNEPDFQTKITQFCSPQRNDGIPLDKKGIHSQKGILHLQYMVKVENVQYSNFFEIPQERVLSLIYDSASLNKGEIIIPIHQRMSRFTHTIMMYLRGSQALAEIQFIFDTNGVFTLLRFSPFQLEKFGAFLFPINEFFNKTGQNILKEIRIVHKHIPQQYYKTVLQLGEIRFLDQKVNHVMRLNKELPRENFFDENVFTTTTLHDKGPINTVFLPQQQIVWNQDQKLQLSFQKLIPSVMEINCVLQGRVQKAFLMRLKLPYTRESFCISLMLPDHLKETMIGRYQNPNVIIHGIKLIPIDEKPNATTHLQSLTLKRIEY